MKASALTFFCYLYTLNISVGNFFEGHLHFSKWSCWLSEYEYKTANKIEVCTKLNMNFPYFLDYRQTHNTLFCGYEIYCPYVSCNLWQHVGWNLSFFMPFFTRLSFHVSEFLSSQIVCYLDLHRMSIFILCFRSIFYTTEM